MRRSVPPTVGFGCEKPVVAGRVGALFVAGLLLLAGCADASSEDPPPTTMPPPTTTSSSVAASFQWPVVSGYDFIHRPSGPVSGAPVSFPDPMWCGCSLVTLDDGRVLMVGSGYGIGYAAWTWDPASREWSATGDPVGEWTWETPGVVLLNDGRVLARMPFGLEIYDPKAGLFSHLDAPVSLEAPYGTFPGAATPVVMSDGRVFFATGSRGGVVFDPGSGTFAAAGSGSIGNPDVIAAVALDDGRVLIVSYLTVSVYDPVTDRFLDRLEPVYPPERGVAVTRLSDGRILFTGGESWSYDSPTPVDLGSTDVQIFDPTTDSFLAAHSMLEPRSHHSAVTMSDGRVVILGGADGRVELFDPGTGLFTQAPELSSPRRGPSVTTLDDGSFLVAGGDDGAVTPGGLTLDTTTSRTAEIYQPVATQPTDPADDVLSGLTLRLEPDIDWSETSERPSDSQWLELDIPPGGLQGAAYAQAVWEFSSQNNASESKITWHGADDRIWGWGGGIERQLPETCDDGCVISEPLFESLPWATVFTGLYVHIEFEGEIPAAASEITLAVVDR